MALPHLSDQVRLMSVMPGLLFSQQRAIANAGAAVERNRRAARQRAEVEAFFASRLPKVVDGSARSGG